MKFFWTQIFLDPQFFGPHFLGSKIFCYPKFSSFQKIFGPRKFLDPTTFGPTFFSTQDLFGPKKLNPYFGWNIKKKFLIYNFVDTTFFKPGYFFKLMSIWPNLYLQSNCLSLDWAPAQLQLVCILDKSQLRRIV